MTAARKPLRALAPDEKPAPQKLNVSQAAESGDHRALLVAMRDRIAKTVADPDCPPRDLAALTRRLQEIARELATLDARAEDEGEVLAGDVDDTYDSEAI